MRFAKNSSPNASVKLRSKNRRILHLWVMNAFVHGKHFALGASYLRRLIINDWSEITQSFLELAIERFKQKHQKGEFNYDKLTKKYWSLLIQQKK